MMPVSGQTAGAVQPLPAERAAPRDQRPEEPRDQRPEEPRDCGRKPVMDEYIPERKEERYVGSTDRVDREIEALKRKREELAQRISAETDGTKIQELERQLAQVERELRQKDSDAYRRQHMEVSRFS